jgi:hypothetical protein
MACAEQFELFFDVGRELTTKAWVLAWDTSTVR